MKKRELLEKTKKENLDFLEMLSKLPKSEREKIKYILIGMEMSSKFKNGDNKEPPAA